MSKRTVIINGQDVSFDELVKFIVSQNKLRAITFLKTQLNLDLREAKAAVEEIKGGNPDRAYQILNPHDACSEPILDGRTEAFNQNDIPKNPFLIQENTIGNRAKYIIIVAIIVLLAGMAASYFGLKEVVG